MSAATHMSATTHKRRLSDSDSNTENMPWRKIRKTTNQDKGRDVPATETTSPVTLGLTKDLLKSAYRAINKNQQELAKWEQRSRVLNNYNTALHQRIEALETDLAQTHAHNRALADEVAITKAALRQQNQTQSAVPLSNIRQDWRSLDKKIAKFVDTYLVDAMNVLPWEYHHFAHLTRVPGPLLCDPHARKFLFQAWVWEYIHANIFDRYSTFWAEDAGKELLLRLDAERGALYDPGEIAAHDQRRSKEVNRLLAEAPATNPQLLGVSQHAFGYFINDMHTTGGGGGGDIRDLVADLTGLLSAAADLDCCLRRSGVADFAVDFPRVVARRYFDGERMSVAHYREAGPEVVLVVTPELHRWGIGGEEEEWGDDEVVVKSRVVVGRREEDEELVVGGEEEEEEEETEEEWREGIEKWLEDVEEWGPEEVWGDEEDVVAEEATTLVNSEAEEATTMVNWEADEEVKAEPEPEPEVESTVKLPVLKSAKEGWLGQWPTTG